MSTRPQTFGASFPPCFSRPWGAPHALSPRRVIRPSNYWRTLRSPRSKLRIIPLGVDPPSLTLSPGERLLARERLVGEGNEMILSVGVLQTRKNTLNALRALETLPEPISADSGGRRRLRERSDPRVYPPPGAWRRECKCGDMWPWRNCGLCISRPACCFSPPGKRALGCRCWKPWRTACL